MLSTPPYDFHIHFYYKVVGKLMQEEVEYNIKYNQTISSND